tara:strand:+ start:17995 stop:18366 length:372 start_codon:yes stop_codon:yes gene_type:complete
MKLGAFSTSLSVQDLAVSKAFYAKLGFEPIAGDGVSYQILRNGSTVVGLFQKMFEGNILTFNPGWDADCNTLDEYEDVRAIRDSLIADGIELTSDTTQDTPKGPASITLVDPDGNAIMFDQHV